MGPSSQRHAGDAALFASLLDPGRRSDPYPVFAEIRRRGPLWIDHLPAAVIGRYDDCHALLRDPRLSSERWRYAGSAGSSDDPIPPDAPVSVWQPSFLSLDPPDHIRIRRLVSKAFAAATIARLEAGIVDLVDQLLDRAGDGDTFDVISGLAYPLPVTVICRLLGVPVEDELRLHRWSSDLALFVDGLALAAAGRERTFDWLTPTIDIHRYMEELVEDRRSTPGNDLISALITVEDAGETLTVEELVATIVLLLVTGHETTVNLIGNCVLAVLRHREYLDAVRVDPTFAPAVVEETVRYDPPVHLAARVAKESLEVRGLPIPAGSLVFLLIAAANRDSAANPDADVFNPRRGRVNHIGFGVGLHYCVGAALAKVQAKHALTRFAQRLVDPVPMQDPPPYREHLNLHGPSALVVGHGGLRA